MKAGDEVKHETPSGIHPDHHRPGDWLGRQFDQEGSTYQGFYFIRLALILQYIQQAIHVLAHRCMKQAGNRTPADHWIRRLKLPDQENSSFVADKRIR